MIAKFFLSLFGGTLIIEKLEAEIERLLEVNKELRDRLFLKHSLPASGINVQAQASSSGEPVSGFLTPRQRVAAHIASLEPPIAAVLNDDELEHLRKVAQ